MGYMKSTTEDLKSLILLLNDILSNSYVHQVFLTITEEIHNIEFIAKILNHDNRYR